MEKEPNFAADQGKKYGFKKWAMGDLAAMY